MGKYRRILLIVSPFLVLVMLVILGCGGEPDTSGFKRGKVALDFNLTDTNGKTVTLSSYRGSVVMLNFWLAGKLNDDDPNRAQLAQIAAALSRLKDRGLAVISISQVGSTIAIRQAIAGKPYTWPFIPDDTLEMTGIYGLGQTTSFPVSIFITPSGKYDSMHSGIISQITIEQAFGFAQRSG